MYSYFLDIPDIKNFAYCEVINKTNLQGIPTAKIS